MTKLKFYLYLENFYLDNYDPHNICRQKIKDFLLKLNQVEQIVYMSQV